MSARTHRLGNHVEAMTGEFTPTCLAKFVAPALLTPKPLNLPSLQSQRRCLGGKDKRSRTGGLGKRKKVNKQKRGRTSNRFKMRSTAGARNLGAG